MAALARNAAQFPVACAGLNEVGDLSLGLLVSSVHQTVLLSVGDRELMAAFVSQMNACEFCIGAHTATAARAYHDEAKVSAVLSDLETAPIEEPLRATLRLLGKLTREHAVTADDMRAVDFAFNTTDRLADAFGFFVPGPKAFEAGAKVLLRRGYQ
jgi:AhpD family alkylhydroperoxidase